MAGDYSTVGVQDMDLYTGSGDVSLFEVEANHDHGDCERWGFKGRYKLSFDDLNINLFPLNGTTPVAKWSYFRIRSFGQHKNVLNITVGQRSSTGRATFSFFTVEGARMKDLIILNSKRLKLKAQKEQNLSEKRVPNDGRKLNSGLTKPTLDFASSLEVKKAPSTLSANPPSNPSPVGSVPTPFGPHFRRELSQTANPTTSNDANSNDLNSSRSSNESFKAQKERKKLAVKAEKKEKRLAKERLKQDTEKQKEEEKRRKKEEKGRKGVIPAGASEDNMTYSPPEVEYAECHNFVEARINQPQPSNDGGESELYNDPWGAGFLLPGPHDEEGKGEDENEDEDEEVYASPIKRRLGPDNAGLAKGMGAVPKGIYYEDVEPMSGVVPPVILPKSWAEEFDHFVNAHPKVLGADDDVYGMASAKPLAPTGGGYENVELTSDTRDNK